MRILLFPPATLGATLWAHCALLSAPPCTYSRIGCCLHRLALRSLWTGRHCSCGLSLKAHNRRCRSQEGRKRDSLPSACICTFSSIEPVSWVRLRPSQRGSNTTTATSSHLSPVQASFACRHFPDSSVVQVGLVIRSWAHSLPTW